MICELTSTDAQDKHGALAKAFQQINCCLLGESHEAGRAGTRNLILCNGCRCPASSLHSSMLRLLWPWTTTGSHTVQKHPTASSQSAPKQQAHCLIASLPCLSGTCASPASTTNAIGMWHVMTHRQLMTCITSKPTMPQHAAMSQMLQVCQAFFSDALA